MKNKMLIEIWSDVVCPFCYIGKRKFETALAQFSGKQELEIVWKSYQLDPDAETEPHKEVYQSLADKYQMSLEDSIKMHRQMEQTAKEVGLEYNFDKVIPANTLLAHQFAHFAKTKGKQEEAEETLFRAYFTEGKNIDDLDTLLDLGASIGLDRAALKTALENKALINQVEADIYEAQQVGVRGVPFFVLNRKYAVSGAQDSSVFLNAIKKAYEEWRKEKPAPKLEIIEGSSCSPEGECD